MGSHQLLDMWEAQRSVLRFRNCRNQKWKQDWAEVRSQTTSTRLSRSTDHWNFGQRAYSLPLDFGAKELGTSHKESSFYLALHSGICRGQFQPHARLASSLGGSGEQDFCVVLQIRVFRSSGLGFRL